VQLHWLTTGAIRLRMLHTEMGDPIGKGLGEAAGLIDSYKKQAEHAPVPRPGDGSMAICRTPSNPTVASCCSRRRRHVGAVATSLTSSSPVWPF
jgi:hypothetical protein